MATEVTTLSETLRGSVLTPADPGYAEVRAEFNAMHDGEPALVVSCSGTADVVDAVNFAREHGLLVAVRGGGHSVAGLSAIDGGMLIDLAPMRGVHVDPERRLAHVQGGALWGDVDRETQAFGLVTPGGVVSDTGVAGLTLGGGYGWLRRKYGLSCDNLVEAQVVCADGQVRTASADSNPDLFWAIRGGGGNFGIVTSFTFELHAARARWSPSRRPSTRSRRPPRSCAAGATTSSRRPTRSPRSCVTITFPANPEMPEAVHDRPCVDRRRRLRRRRRRGHAASCSRCASSAPSCSTCRGRRRSRRCRPASTRSSRATQLQAYWKSQYLDELSDEAIDAIAAKAQDRPAPLTLVNTFHMGGAIADVDPEDTAFAERSAPFMVSIDGMWADPADDDAQRRWVRSTWEDDRQFGTGGVYLNFTGLADEAPSAGVDSAFGRNLQRLAEVKATYDPDNFFRLNNNIKPA